jgi:hypothetical protein
MKLKFPPLIANWIARILCVSLFVTQGAFSNASEASLWGERQRKYQAQTPYNTPHKPDSSIRVNLAL